MGLAEFLSACRVPSSTQGHCESAAKQHVAKADIDALCGVLHQALQKPQAKVRHELFAA